jgi:hypothetical protein
MHALIYLSLCLNIAVLVPVCLSILMRADWTTTAYGPDTPARGILLAIYFAILVYSAGLLFKPIPAMVVTLLMVQVVYKVMTPFTVGRITNPVVVCNLAIAVVHSFTLWAIWKAIGL